MILTSKIQDTFVNQTEKTIYGIYVDDDNIHPPHKLTEVSFIFIEDDEGLIDEKCIDAIISYKLSGAKIILEVPYEFFTKEHLNASTIDKKADYLLQLSTNVVMDLSLLPPNKDKYQSISEEYSIYQNILILMVEKMLSRNNYENFVYPISNFMEFMIMEILLKKDLIIYSEHEYTKNNFIAKIDNKTINGIKDELRNKIYQIYGSRDEFEQYAIATSEGVIQRTKEMLKENAEKIISDINGKNKHG